MAKVSRTKNRLGKAEQSRRTRELILAAATKLFVRDGYLSTTMADIAAEAGVSVQALYLSFGGKGAILHKTLDIAVAGDDEPVPMQDRVQARAGMESPDGVAALTSFLDISGAVIARVSPLWGVLRSAAADPEVAELLARSKRERREIFRQVVRELSTKPGFATELSAEDATSVLYALQSEDMYALLVQEQGWSVAQWRDWVLRTVRAQLFPQANP